MTGRDSVVALGALVVAIGIAVILLVGSMNAASADGAAQRFFFVNFAGRGTQVIRPAAGDGAGVPVPLRAVVPFQRGVSDAARDAAGYLLVVIGVSAALVLGKGQVLGAYHASSGGWRSQLRVLGTGFAVILLLASAAFLGGVVLLGTVATGFRDAPTGIQLGLQVGIMTMAVFGAVFLMIALIGFTAMSWRLGDAIFGARPLNGWAARVPGAIIALLGATVLYVLAQVPEVGRVIGMVVLAYALGAVVIARLGPSPLATRADQ